MISVKTLPSSGGDNPGKNQASTSTQSGQSVMLRLIMNGAGLPQTTTSISQCPIIIPAVTACSSTSTKLEQKPQVLSMTRNDELIRRLSSDIHSTKLYPTIGANLVRGAAPMGQGIPTSLSIPVSQIMSATAGMTAITSVPAKLSVANSVIIRSPLIADIGANSTEAEAKPFVVSTIPKQPVSSANPENTVHFKAADSANTSSSENLTNPSNTENPDNAATPHVFVKSKRSSKRPTQRLRMRPWLLMLLNSGEIPGLQWVRKEQQIFSIPWKHASGRTWKGKDADLFERYALHTGKHIPGGQPDHKRWKANFRCALNSLHDVEELQDKSMKTGEFAHKLYRFLSKADKKSLAAKKSEKVRDRRRSDSSGGDIADQSESQNNSGSDAKPKYWIYDELTGECKPPEIKDHNYSFNKGDLVSPVIDPQEMRDLLSNAPDSVVDNEDQSSENVSMETSSVLDALPRLPFFRNSIDHTIDKVIEKSRKKNRVKSELIIDDRSAQFVSNVMEVDTSPVSQSEDSARIALAHSLVSLNGGSFSEDPGLVTEESSFAASILIDLSRMKRSSGVRERLHSFVSERMEVEASTSDAISGKTDQVPQLRASVETPKCNFESKKVTSSRLLAGALKTSSKKHITDPDPDKSQMTPYNDEEKNSDLDEVKISKPLDLRIKTEPLGDGYEDSMETNEFRNQSFTNIFPSARNQFYRSSTESSESEEEDDLGSELIPPPAHSSFHSLTEIDDEDIPQPLDLSVKVHNLVITDVSPSAKKGNASKPQEDKQYQRDMSKRNFDESFQDSEPLNLKVKKNCDRETSSNRKISLPVNASESQSSPLDLSIVKSEPIDDPYNDYPQSTSVAMETEVINRIGPVPDLIEAPIHRAEENASTKTYQSVNISNLSPLVLAASSSSVDMVSTPQTGSSGMDLRTTVSPNTSSTSLSSPTISFLLGKKSDLPCRLCDKKFVSTTDLSLHMTTAHAQVKTTAHVSHQKRHLCPICPKSFQKEANLSKHMKKHICESSVQCTDCKSIFTNKEFYLKHQSNCTASASPPCSRLKNVRQQQQPQESNVTENGDVINPFQCGICNSRFEQIEDLKTHMESKRLLVRCSVCHKLFTKQSSETLENTFMCSVCENEKQTTGTMEDLFVKPSLSAGMSLLLQAVERTVNKDVG